MSYGNMLESVIGGVSQRVTTEWAGVIRLLEGLVFPVGLCVILSLHSILAKFYLSVQ